MLSDEQVAEIKALSGDFTQRQIAEKFGVAISTVNDILRGRTHRKEVALERIKRLFGSSTTQKGKKNLNELREKAEMEEPLFEDSDYPTGPPASADGIREIWLSQPRRGKDVA
jgi:transcriptional regulator with XRE-family HTH domain